VAQGQLEVKGKSTEQKKGDIGLGEEREVRPVAGCLGGGDGDAGRTEVEKTRERRHARPHSTIGHPKNLHPRARPSVALGEMKGTERKGKLNVVHSEPAAVLATRPYSILLLYDRTLENQNGRSFFNPNAVASPSSKFIDSYSLNSNLFHRPNGRDRSVSVIRNE
jgi:hypothetical protein